MITRRCANRESLPNWVGVNPVPMSLGKCIGGWVTIILSEYIEVGISYLNIEHYKKLGYEVKCGQKIIVPVEHLSEQSNKVVKVKCDVCGNEKNLKYQIYQLSIKNGGYYANTVIKNSTMSTVMVIILKINLKIF